MSDRFLNIVEENCSENHAEIPLNKSLECFKTIGRKKNLFDNTFHFLERQVRTFTSLRKQIM